MMQINLLYEKKPCGSRSFHSAFEEESGDHGSVLTPAKTQGVTDDIDIEMVRKSQEFQTATPTFTTQGEWVAYEIAFFLTQQGRKTNW